MDGEEDNCAIPCLLEFFHKEQGGHQDSGSHLISHGILEAAATDH